MVTTIVLMVLCGALAAVIVMAAWIDARREVAAEENRKAWEEVFRKIGGGQ